jgi:hypothetical protein
MKSKVRRVLLMGDSFTEAVGMSFEQSFAGLLYQAGGDRLDRIDFLNAGVQSYSPVIYYKKIKFLLRQGLQFDEVVVFSDMSDVLDEAKTYFCIDEDPRYLAYCDPKDIIRPPDVVHRLKRHLQNNFVVTDEFFFMIKRELRRLRGKDVSLAIPSKDELKDEVLYKSKKILWDREEPVDAMVDAKYAPLGIEGGIARSLQNMQKLSDLLGERGIPLTIVVYPWPVHLAHNYRESRQVAIWQDFCVKNCKRFINLFPTLFVEKRAHEDWYEQLFIEGDVHFSAEGNKVLFRELSKYLL